jgi:RNA polymerase sigma-70 factor, ECF subfamily
LSGTRLRLGAGVSEDQDDATRVNDRVESVYAEHGAALWRALLMFTADPEVASDSMSEAFAQALAGGASIRDVRAWVWTAAFKIARGELKRAHELSHEANAMPDVEIITDHRDEVLAVLQAMQKLPTSQRAAIILHHFAGYPLADVGRILGMSRSAVGVHLYRGRVRLRKRLEDIDA